MWAEVKPVSDTALTSAKAGDDIMARRVAGKRALFI
jgi:hypothetical protein